jgi:hypothetical protein
MKKVSYFPNELCEFNPLVASSSMRSAGRLSKATITTDHGTFHFANIIEAE